ncbi:S-layer homology domain-containing protein [Patescibacteria group bacterium]|nr:S-layer homology domain-containing protein [Patescibacteria group bacterium]
MSQIDDLLSYLRNQVGKPYVLGAIGPNEFDCSGLTYAAFKEVTSLEIPRVSSDQFGAGKKVDEADIKEGDLVFFDTGWSKRKPNHLGVCIGNGNMINANSYYSDVHEESYLSAYWSSKFMGARRIIGVESSFKDLFVEDIFFSFVSDLYDRGVVEGYPVVGAEKPEFKPDGDINRAEILKIILLAFNIPIKESGSLTFPDVKDTDWFFKYVLTAFENSIIDGYPDGSFGPANSINRVEALKMILEAAKVDLSVSLSTNFDDVKEADWFYKYVAYAYDKYLISPQSETYYGCAENMSRGEVCMTISKLI